MANDFCSSRKKSAKIFVHLELYEWTIIFYGQDFSNLNATRSLANMLVGPTFRCVRYLEELVLMSSFAEWDWSSVWVVRYNLRQVGELMNCWPSQLPDSLLALEVSDLLVVISQLSSGPSTSECLSSSSFHKVGRKDSILMLAGLSLSRNMISSGFLVPKIQKSLKTLRKSS